MDKRLKAIIGREGNGRKDLVDKSVVQKNLTHAKDTEFKVAKAYGRWKFKPKDILKI